MEFIVFLDSDDLIEKDYLKKSALLLKTSPKAGWIYPNIRMFGYFDHFLYAPQFNALKLFLNNYCVSASLYRKSAWIQVSQREKFVIKNVRFFEDWDTTIRLMSKGWFGLPLNDSDFRYRQHYKSMVIRTSKILALTIYIVWRSNIVTFLKIFKAQIRYNRDFEEGFKKRRNFFNPKKLFDFVSSSIAKKILKTQVLVRDDYKVFFPFEFLFFSVFYPKKFIEKYLDPTYNITLAESHCGFVEKPKMDFEKIFPVRNNTKKSIIFAHPWWHIGGAENILLDWIKSSRNIKNIKIINLAEKSLLSSQSKAVFLENEFEMLREEFLKYSDEQYAIDKIAKTPLKKVKFCWNLLANERPNILFISSSCFLYSLLPSIKKEFPFIKVVDILHNECGSDSGWFGISDEYKQFIDKRIVTSDVWKEVLIKKYGEKKEKIEVFNNQVDLKKYDPKKYNKTKTRKLFGVKSDKFIIGFIGRFHDQKNPMVFLELAELMKDNPEFRFIMVGAGEMEEDVRKRVASLSNIKLFSYSPDVYKYMSMCDLLIFPSRFEGAPLIGLEAAAMNVPIIATDTIGFREQVTDGKFGFLYQQKNTHSDVRKIREIILINKNKFSRIGKNGRKFVSKYHNLENGSKNYRRFIESLL